jgi:hypothetical protein
LGIKPNRQGFIVEKIIKRIATSRAGQRDLAGIDYIKTIYGTSQSIAFNPAWANLLATEAPFEDFVETYKLVALAASTAQITSIVLDFADGTSSNNVLNNLKVSKSTLLKKANCLVGSGGLTGQLLLLPLQP